MRGREWPFPFRFARLYRYFRGRPIFVGIRFNIYAHRSCSRGEAAYRAWGYARKGADVRA